MKFLRWLRSKFATPCPHCEAHVRESEAVRRGDVPCSMCQRPADGVLFGVSWCRDCVPGVVAG